MKIEFYNLDRQYELLKEDINEAIFNVINHKSFIKGKENDELERKLADFLGVRFALGTSSGTSALLVSLLCYDYKSRNKIITTPFTFAATAEVIPYVGAVPVFVDIDKRTYNLNPVNLENILKKEKDVAGIIGVDIFGQCCDYDRFREIIDDNIFILEDGAQSFGAVYKGKKAGSLGDVSITSFFPAKPFGTYGDGGMIFTNYQEILEKARLIINHGQKSKYEHSELGLNFRFNTMPASILLAKFSQFKDIEIEKRSKIADKYNGELKELENEGLIVLPFIELFNKSIYSQYSIQTDKRDDLYIYLKSKNIPTAIHYPKPLHLQNAFSYLGYKEGDLPIAEMISKRIISLPFCPYKTNEEIEYICKSIKEFFKN